MPGLERRLTAGREPSRTEQQEQPTDQPEPERPKDRPGWQEQPRDRREPGWQVPYRPERSKPAGSNQQALRHLSYRKPTERSQASRPRAESF